MHRYLRAGDLFTALYRASAWEVQAVREKLGVPVAKPTVGLSAPICPKTGRISAPIPHAHHSHPEPSAL